MRKLLIFIAFFSIILGTNKAWTQDFLHKKIDFSVTELPVNQALDQLASQTGIDIAYSKSFFRRSDPVSIDLKQSPIEEVLKEIIQNTGIDYKTLGANRVLLFKRKAITYTISGYVQDAETGERIIGAKVYSHQQQKGGITNEYGFYSFILEEGKVELNIRSVGFKEKNISVNLNKDFPLTIEMDLITNLPAVVVDADDKDEDDHKVISIDQNNGIEIAPILTNSTPDLGGQPDYVRVAQMLPGIQSESDGLGGITVRGSEPGQNLIMMDGTPVYIPYHLLGLYSIYNPSLVKSTRVLRGNFPARYGSFVSSVMDIRIREGDLYKWRSSAEFNLINGALSVEGPLKKGKGSVLIAGRYSPGAFLFEAPLRELYFQNRVDLLQTSFYDMNIKANYAVSKKDRVYFSFFTGADVMEQRYTQRTSPIDQEHSNFELDWNNTLGSFRWNHQFNKKLFLNTTLTYSNYGNRFSALHETSSVEPEATKIDRFVTDNRSINMDYGVKLDFDYTASSKHKLRFGLNYNYRDFSPSNYFLQEQEFDASDSLFGVGNFDFSAYYSTLFVPVFSIHESAVYLEDHISLRRWFFNIGARVSAFVHQTAEYVNIEPRAIAKYKLNEFSHLSASFNRRNQYLHQISNPSIQLPNDLWLPATETIKPQELYEGELAFQYRPIKNLRLNLAAYYRHINHIYSYPETFDFLFTVETFSDYDYLEEGKAMNRGLEFFADYSDQSRGLLFTYTLSKAERQFDAINFGNKFYTNFDSRHQINLAFYHRLGKLFKAGVNWVYKSPRPKLVVWQVITEEGVQAFNDDPPGMLNTTRINSYNRIDVNVQFEHIGEKVQHFVKVGMYNALNTQNIAFYSADGISADGEVVFSTPLHSLPVMPSFSYKISF